MVKWSQSKLQITWLLIVYAATNVATISALNVNWNRTMSAKLVNNMCAKRIRKSVDSVAATLEVKCRPFVLSVRASGRQDNAVCRFWNAGMVVLGMGSNLVILLVFMKNALKKMRLLLLVRMLNPTAQSVMFKALVRNQSSSWIVNISIIAIVWRSAWIASGTVVQ